MGIHRFFPWFKSTFDNQIKYIYKNNKLRVVPNSFLENDYVDIDNLMIDLNGIIHASAQKIYEYGSYSKNRRLLRDNKIKPDINSNYKQIKVFEDICETINKLFLVVEPNKRLIICIDGPAPQSKQSQQRKRRFKSALENENVDDINSFDSNSITPGTKFMDSLSKYIDYYIRKMISNNDKWKNISVIFSNEKVPGEGEHKAISFVRNNKLKNPNDSYCIHGLDSDLVMLTLGTYVDKFYILRDENYNMAYDYLLINIGGVRNQLIHMMNWEYDITDFKVLEKSKIKFIDNYAINDFILICFLIGNDFLPQIPSIEILSGGINLILDIYRIVCKEYGHLTKMDITGNVIINIKPMVILLSKVGEFEKNMMIEKITEKVFTDDILEKTKIYNQTLQKFDLDIVKYKELYYNTKFNSSIKDVVHSYFEGMQWVLSYYTKGVPCWKWSYKHNYAPFALDIALNIDDYIHKLYPKSIPNTPFKQLLCVLSPYSYKLIPYPLCNLLVDSNSPIIDFYPKKIEIDLSGKHKEYEGVVILPKIDMNLLDKAYDDNIINVDFRDIKRNNLGKTFLYMSSKDINNFKCYYGEILNSNVYVKFIDL